MADDWNRSAAAWIAGMGDHGDYARRHILDPAMLARLDGRTFSSALDVGCGEGRFCRLLRTCGVDAVGLDPTAALIAEARSRDPKGRYLRGRAEDMAFASESFDLVVSYLTLIDIPGLEAAIREMNRVLTPGGTLLIANLTSFNTAGMETSWITDESGRHLHYPVDRYLEERACLLEFEGLSIENWHRPLGTYMTLLLDQGLQLVYFSEPVPQGGDPERGERYRRAPWFLVMEWLKPAA